jgi:hypothetical protein
VNKVVAILGIIVLITLGGLFFCAGFFTGTTVLPSGSSSTSGPAKGDAGDSVSVDSVESAIDTKSTSISDKIMEILASAAETATTSISNVVDRKNSMTADESAHVSIDSLLREIAAGHATDDPCSPASTQQKMSTPAVINPNSLHGKRIVFVGYFKNKIALEVQKLLITKGYKAHVELSRTGDGESFVFCGPFKKEKNAQTLVKWLRKHDFSEARVVSVSSVAMEETLYDAVNEDGPPQNVEKDIPDMHPIGQTPVAVHPPVAAVPIHPQTPAAAYAPAQAAAAAAFNRPPIAAAQVHPQTPAQAAAAAAFNRPPVAAAQVRPQTPTPAYTPAQAAAAFARPPGAAVQAHPQTPIPTYTAAQAAAAFARPQAPAVAANPQRQPAQQGRQ